MSSLASGALFVLLLSCSPVMLGRVLSEHCTLYLVTQRQYRVSYYDFELQNPRVQIMVWSTEKATPQTHVWVMSSTGQS